MMGGCISDDMFRAPSADREPPVERWLWMVTFYVEIGMYLWMIALPLTIMYGAGVTDCGVFCYLAMILVVV